MIEAMAAHASSETAGAAANCCSNHSSSVTAGHPRRDPGSPRSDIHSTPQQVAVGGMAAFVEIFLYQRSKILAARTPAVIKTVIKPDTKTWSDSVWGYDPRRPARG